MENLLQGQKRASLAMIGREQGT